MKRLDILSTQLAAALRQAPEERQRAASLTACEFAVQRTGVESPIVEGALQMLRDSKPFPPDHKVALEALAGRLDDEYFGLQEAVEEGRATVDDYMRAFGQARAVTALSFAANRDAYEAAYEAIYEAASATDDKEELVAAVRKMLE